MQVNLRYAASVVFNDFDEDSLDGPVLISVLRLPNSSMSLREAWDCLRISNSALRCCEDSSELVYFGLKNSSSENLGLCITIQDIVNDVTECSGTVYINR